MVRITKPMQAKHFETLSPYLKEFRTTACSIPLPHLPQHLASFPTTWPFPRGDLYHWTSLLNRFDAILENFCRTYKLDEGPQTRPFGCKVLVEPGESSDTPNLVELGYGSDGDRELIESILTFSRMLLQNCGNRSLYASSAHLNSLLNTTSLSLLEITLSLGSELAQRYLAAFKRQAGSSRQPNNPQLLQNHYNINLDRVQQLALPFTKTVVIPADPVQSTMPTTPSVKGKEKANFTTPISQKPSTTTVRASDLVSMAKGGSGVSSRTSGPKTSRNSVDSKPSQSETTWAEWGDVKVTYYPKAARDSDLTRGNSPAQLSHTAHPNNPTTPTPIRRSSNLGSHVQRPGRGSSFDESPTAARSSAFSTEEVPRATFKTIEITSSELKSTGVHGLLEEHIAGLPEELQYELLTKLRVAEALTSSLETRRQILAIRLLAITNLSYIHLEAAFTEKVMKNDNDEPRRLQLIYQLAELVHPPVEADTPIPVSLQTIAFSTLDALSQHPSKYNDVCSALSTNVSHGVLLYVVRKAVAGMGEDPASDAVTEQDEWRDALFSLLSNISMMPRAGGELITAGLMPILVEILGLRTAVAERYHHKVLGFLDNIMYSARDAFQTLVNADGLQAISDLIVYEVTNSSENVAQGKGMRVEYRSAAVDYEIPFFQQQTLKWLFKFIHHMMTTAGGYGGNFDRLLRNLIDSSQLLGSLREIISNGQCFGSVVWTNAVGILNDFINNEPTSFAVIAEAGLSRAFLEAVTCSTITMPPDSKKTESQPDQPSNELTSDRPSTSEHTDDDEEDDDEDDDGDSDEEFQPEPRRPTTAMLQTPREGPLAKGIMPTHEAINIIPQAFGAICLNNDGMKMFLASRALESFFEIFESPEHIKCMDANKDLPSNLGGSFDELVRHHPPLKTAIMNAILDMVARVSHLCKTKAEKNKLGAVLRVYDATGQPVIAGPEIRASYSSKSKEKAVDDGEDVEMEDAEAPSIEAATSESDNLSDSSSMTPYVATVATFLSTIFSNTTVRSEFCTKGGIEYVLDLAESPCLAYDFADGSASRILHGVIALLAEQKPHLTMPSLLQRAQAAANILEPFANYQGTRPFFKPFVDKEAQLSADVELLTNGTNLAKAMVNVHSLVSTVHACLHPTSYNHRNAVSSLTQLNLGDYYAQLVKTLGPLLGACFREEYSLDKAVPDSFESAVRAKNSALSDTLFTGFLGDPEVPSPAPEPLEAEAGLPTQPNGASSIPVAAGSPTLAVGKPKPITKAERDSPEFKNFQVLRYLLRKMPRTISPFFQILGKGLVPKRSGTDVFQKQSHAAIADALAETILRELASRGQDSSMEGIGHCIGMLHVLKDMLTDVSRHSDRPVQVIALVLQAFKQRGGFDTTNRILEVFAANIRQTSSPSDTLDLDRTAEETIRSEMAVVIVKEILSIYNQVVNGKNVTESVYTMSMVPRDGRDRSRPDYFSPDQFLLELRMAVLPVVRRLWESDLSERAPSEVAEKLIDVIRTIANADNEIHVAKRSDKSSPPSKSARKLFKLSADHLSTLIEDHKYDPDLAQEALYRCSNNITYSLEYCSEVVHDGRRRNPIPEGDVPPSQEQSNSSRPRTNTSTGTATPDDHPMGMDDTVPSVPAIIDSLSQQISATSTSNDGLAPHLVDELLNSAVSSPNNSRASQSSAPPQSAPPEENKTKQITIDDLNEERAAIRGTLIDKCLEVINAHGGVTFQVADLITTTVNKSPDPSNLKASVGSTLVVALMSFAGDDDLRTSGKKIAAYAHLVALLLKDKSFYSSVVSELKNHLPMLLGFIKLPSNHSSDEPSPWIPPILLVVELLLSEDSRPRKTKWVPPRDENDKIEAPVLEAFEPAVSSDERTQLLEAVLDILPRIGKDESLALSVLRVLVILTRSRTMAQVVGEKKNIQRLFVAAKQLAGATSSRIQSPLMLILRHIIEDDETVKQIMRSDIKLFFEQNRQQRSLDITAYLRGLAPTAVRSPEFFVEVTNEMVKFSRWSYANSDSSSSRSNTLVLKDQFASGSDPARRSEDSVQPTVQATEDLSIQDVKASTEETDSQMPDASKVAHAEHKLPVVENPDGVIHFLLCELLNYKDVEDKDPATAATAASPIPQANVPTATDVNMAEVGSTASAEGSANKEEKSKAKEDFKPEDHPIYIYRCFLLQCLTELLASYNRTKIEFINFKRSVPPQAMTPSKPRSSVVNYLLTDLIPAGTVDSAGSQVAYRKRTTTSSWADSVLVALLAKTGEQLVDKSREQSDGEDEPNLLFVRRFVLENVLKAYKEASASNESLDIKYARMLSLAVLMGHIMNGKDTIGATDTSLANRSHQQLRRVMFEKGFIGALTASIADVDLNFPGAKETVRQILKPLKVLTNTAIHLSDLSLVSGAQGQTEDDGIESATSVSDLEDDREETPDLFRNSTLGMFEPDREEESSSESEDEDDEEMYDDGYGDEMEYEEDIGEDEEDNISEEDEDIEGIGHIEGLPGDHAVDVEVIMEEEDDDDDDDDDDDEDSDDDDDHGSEDDDARVEIIDELGEAQHLAEEDDLDEWESDEGEDEGEDEEDDYEAQAQEEDEAHLHQGLDVTSMVGGPLGNLVRALGGGEDAVDILERMEEQMEAEGLDAGDDEDRIGGDYMEEGDGDEDDDEEEDMDEEEMFLEQGYPGGGPPGGFEWEGDVDPPMTISHRGHHHRPRHAFGPPFPLFPGGLRGDPLGGMSPPSHISISVQVPDELRNLPRRELDGLIQQVMTRYMGPEGRNSNGTNPNAVPEYRPAYRSHRPPQQRSTDDGLNPLLQPGAAANLYRDRPVTRGSDWIQALSPPGESDLLDLARLGGPFGEGPATAALFDMLRSLPEFPGTIARNGPAGLSFHITGGHFLDMPAGLRAIIGGSRGARFEVRGEATEPGNAAFFTPQSTAARWVEEAKLLFGPNNHEKANDLRSAIESVLVPPAIEADKTQKAAELERLRKLEEEAKKKAEEERLAREAKEEEERIAKEKKEADEREAAERAAAEARAARGVDSEATEEEAAEGAHAASEAMDGVESEAEPPAEAETHTAPAEDRPRVTTMIRGNPFDITDLGIDAEFLAELPEEIREEVIMTAVAERRSQAAATGAQPSEIDQEFLDALPEDIRDEIIQQERQDRRRREREEQRRQAAAAGGPAAAGDMDAASILATLPPALRQQVLMEQDEEMLSLLPQELADQARAAQRDHPAHGRIGGGLVRRNPPIVGIDAGQPHGTQRPQRRSIVQMLDKSGIATLLRLMFTLQPDHLKTALWAVLENICMNRHNRTEVVSTILHILQDGSADMGAVERSFAQLSLRAKQPPKEKDQKTPLPLKRTHTGMSTSSGITSLIQANSEASPLLVVQQCLGTLNNLVGRNLHIPAFFLTEHDTSMGTKRTLSRKGKGKEKENKASKYAINSLLNLLDRDLIMENSTVMELLSGLLNQITQPLQALQRKQKETEAAKTEAAPSTTENTASVASPENTEQPIEEHVENVATEAPLATDGGEAATSEPQKLEENKEEKKQRPLTPPVIPEYNLKLVINIFVARECSSRTFRETLSTIKNLSAIPGAKAVFGRELIAKAQGLGEVILLDLEALLPQIQKATSGTEIQGVALAKFSPGGSEQGKLLRVLTALDHLFDPKRDKKDKPEEEGESSQVAEKQDLLSSLYENSTFGPMWERLSACLTVIRQRDHMLNVATILLPLIESLMVVCKNTTLKDAPLARSQMGKDMTLTSPPPESRMESLFFTFTEDHRKILNDLVRNSPKLMSGTFSLLVKNPKVLEFDNKRNYFSRSIHNKSSNTRQSFPPLQLSVRREQVFHDSFKALYFQTADQMKFGKLSIRFHGEEGVDAGGVTREWFQVLSRQMFDPGYALFIPVSSDRTTFHPNQLSSVNEEHLMFFKFIGRIIGKALYEGRVLDCHFSRAVYKRILGKAVSLKDMESLDPDYYKSLVWMLENDITDIITETFSVDNDKFGVVETIEFIPNGRNISVTEENKHEYVRLMVEWRLTGSVKEQLDEFLKGFHDIIPAELIAIFNEQELELLISGLPEIDVDDWKSSTEYHNYSASSSQIQWFWRAVRSFDKEERAKLLQFVTGTSKVPLNGFKELEGMNGFSRFNIHRDYGSKDRLPSSHTCFNQLDLPEYESYEVLRQQVLTAITAGSQYFGFA